MITSATNKSSDLFEILLVEDEESDAKLICRAFAKVGIPNQMNIIRDGEQALRFLLEAGNSTAHPLPGLVLLDLKLPRISGLEVLARIKQTDMLKRIPIVVLSSSDETSDIQRAYDLGANSYLVKPVTYRDYCELAGEIQEYWLRRNRRPEVNC